MVSVSCLILQSECGGIWDSFEEPDGQGEVVFESFQTIRGYVEEPECRVKGKTCQLSEQYSVSVRS